MSNIYKAFENKKAFIAFLTAGDPDFETSLECFRAVVRGGADLIEVGIPFSDPIAEGPVIQEADIRALNAGMTTDRVFDLLRECIFVCFNICSKHAQRTLCYTV